MTSEDSQFMPLSAQIIEPTTSAATLDSLHLRIAIQAAPYRYRSGFTKILESLDHGQSLQDAVQLHRETFSGETQALIDAALKLPEPTRFLLDATSQTENHSPLRWQLRMLIAYPLIMIGVASGFCAVISQSLNAIMKDGFADFGLVGFDVLESRASDQLSANIAIFASVLWCLVIAITIRLCGPRWSFVAVMGGVPLIGKPIRWLSLSELTSRFASVLKQVPETTKATEILAASFRDSQFEMVTQLIHRRIQGGTSIGTAISQSILSDGLCSPVLLTLDRSKDVSLVCEQIANTIKTMAEARCRVVSGIMPLLVLTTIATIVWGTLSGYIHMMLMLLNMFGPFVTLLF